MEILVIVDLASSEREGWSGIFARFASGSPPFFVSKWIRQEEYERGRESSRLGCLLGRVGKEKGKKEKEKNKI
jgi:hypothetical protein